MGFHHVAIAVRDAETSHRFYTEAMGFTLVRTEVIDYLETGWARHLFYDIGDGTMLALWDLHHESGPVTKTAISIDLGLPHFVNHIAFASADLADLDARQHRLLAHGIDVARIDHGWCTSIYTADPNDIMVEFCCTTRVFDADDHAEAAALLAAEQPPLGPGALSREYFEAAATRSPDRS
ncbi:MAG: VOC family protein [Actinomycetota bacterium]